MLRSFFRSAKRISSKSTTPLYQSHDLTFSSKAYFAVNNDSYSELRLLSKLLGTQYFRFNREISHNGDVRLLDAGNRLIGLYNIEEARKKCEELNMDIVMINGTARPPICRAIDYKEDLYKKFIKEVIEKDLPRFNKARARAVASKSLKLGPKMSVADLKTKISSAQEIAKKFKSVRVYMKVKEEEEEAGKNVIYTFRDLSHTFLKARGEIDEGVREEGEEGAEEEEVEEGKTLSLSFQSLIFAGETDMKNLTEEELKDMIQTYIKRESKGSALDDVINDMIKSGDHDVKAAKMESKSAHEDDDQFRLLAEVENYFINAQREGIQDVEAAEEQEVELPPEVEEIRMKFGEERSQALMSYLFSEQEERVNSCMNLLKMKRLYEKQKGIYKRK